MQDPINPEYCIVKYYHYEATHKPLDCKKCVMNCKHKGTTGGDINDKPTN